MRFWACLLVLLILLPSFSEAAKKKKKKARQQQTIEQTAPAQAPAAPPAVDPWQALQEAITLKDGGQLDPALAKLEQVASIPSAPIEWCYARLHMADVYFRQGNAADGAVKTEKYRAGRDRFTEAVICVRQPSPDRVIMDGTDWEADATARLGEAERAAIEEFRAFGTDDLARQLEAVSRNQARTLYDAGDHEQLVAHWKYHVALYGVSRQAYFNIGMACLELGDLEGARQSVLEAQEMPEGFKVDLPDPVGAAVERATSMASEAAAGSPERDEYYRFLFGLLAEWHEREPMARQPKDLLAEALIPVERQERLRLLTLAEDCWIPMEIFERLQSEDREFIDEARIAIECDPDNPTTRSALAHTYYAEAKQEWGSLKMLNAEEFSRVGKISEHIRLAKSVLAQLEKALEIDPGFSTARNLQTSVQSYLSQMQAQTTDLRKEQRAETMLYCNKRWTVLTWWADRRFELLGDTPTVKEISDFERECAEFIRKKDLDVGIESIREEVEESQLLLRCREKLQAVRAGRGGMEQFEKDCPLYVEYFKSEVENAKQ